MKSNIKVDFKGLSAPLGSQAQFEPVIKILLEDSEDVRDRLLKTFFESLGTRSSWLQVSFDHHIINGDKESRTYITLTPVTDRGLLEMRTDLENRIFSYPEDKKSNYNPLVDIE